MQPALVFPIHDPGGSLFPRLQAIDPLLQENFGAAWVVVSAETGAGFPAYVDWLAGKPFYQSCFLEKPQPVGTMFAYLYRWAAAGSPADRPLHLCYLDRLAFALLTEHRSSFLADIAACSAAPSPLIFQRSQKAWSTHPHNYFEMENFVTRVGEFLFGRPLDFAWCHFLIRAALLKEIMPQVTHSDLSMVAEMVLPVLDRVVAKEVDWLAWEDPFILSRDPAELKRERESSHAETDKRLAYVLPMLEILRDHALARYKADSE